VYCVRRSDFSKLKGTFFVLATRNKLDMKEGWDESIYIASLVLFVNGITVCTEVSVEQHTRAAAPCDGHNDYDCTQ
jgi:hypothetical protein